MDRPLNEGVRSRVEPPYPLHSVDNALRVLLMLEEAAPLRLTDVATRLGVARSTAHRLLGMLEYRGFVARDGRSKTYRAGSALIELSSAAARSVDIREAAQPHMQALRAATAETVHLLMLEGPSVRFVDGLEGPQGLRVGARTGLRAPAYATSGGKALLAQLDDAVVDVLFPRGLRQVTRATVADRDQLREELARVRRAGYATNFGESEQRVSGVGVCVVGPVGRPVAALAVAAPSERLSPDDAPAIARVVAREVQDFATRLGGSGGGMTVPDRALRLLESRTTS